MSGIQAPAGAEIFIGLCGATVTNLREVTERLKIELQRVGYQSRSIRLSASLPEFGLFSGLASVKEEDKRIEGLMTAGDEVRRIAGRGDAVALLAIAGIQREREAISGSATKPAGRFAYILHSLKRPEEVRTFRTIYGSSFFVVSVFSPVSRRAKALCERIAESRQSYNTDQFEAGANALIKRDRKDAGTLLGQDVEATFPEADFFLDAKSPSAIHSQVSRFVEILFAHPFKTPTVDEYGMFHAKAASLRTADLSRQVGAVIVTESGEILTAGCNEVPRATGGSNWDDVADTDSDYRDFRKGHDSTARMKHELLAEIFEKLSGWFSAGSGGQTPEQMAIKALHEGNPPILKGTRADSLLEFGRIVHAEMTAITEAARRGIAVKGTRLYCTTFPCHMCARHIVASGILEVIYIEPYPKSMAKELYNRAIRVDEDDDADADAVAFRPFVGVAPRRFLEFFQAVVRKDERGHAMKWVPLTAQPRLGQITEYKTGELGAMDFIVTLLPKLAGNDLFSAGPTT